MKKLFLGIGILLALIVIVGAAILVPPHVQIRGIEPALPSLSEVERLRAVDHGPIRISAIETGTQPIGDRAAGNTVFVIEWEDGRLFMVDAGMDRAAAVDFANQMKLLGASGELAYRNSAAQALGDKIKNVAGVGFTHLHIDHTQGVLTFCERRGAGAKVYQTALQATTHNLHTKEGAKIVRESCLESVVVSGEGIIAVPNFPGLWMMGVGGHTPCSTVFFAKVGNKLWVLSGDVSNDKRDLLANKGKGFVYSYLLVPENTQQLDKLRRWLTSVNSLPSTEVIVSHDDHALMKSEISKL